jgi:hypothetical protein
MQRKANGKVPRIAKTFQRIAWNVWDSGLPFRRSKVNKMRWDVDMEAREREREIVEIKVDFV